MKKSVIVFLCCLLLCYGVHAEDFLSQNINESTVVETAELIDELEDITELSPFDDIIENADKILEENKDNPIVKFFKRLADIVFKLLNQVLDKATQSITEMINAHETFTIEQE